MIVSVFHYHKPAISCIQHSAKCKKYKTTLQQVIYLIISGILSVTVIGRYFGNYLLLTLVQYTLASSQCERPAGRGLRATPAGNQLVTWGARKTARLIREAGAAGPPATGRRRGAFSTLLRQSGLRASTGGVPATKSERKMLASTCLYSLYAWFFRTVAIICHGHIILKEGKGTGKKDTVHT